MIDTHAAASKEVAHAPSAAGVIHNNNNNDDDNKNNINKSTTESNAERGTTTPHDEKPHTLISSKTLGKDNLKQPGLAEVASLDVSLHTTCSDISIDLDEFLAASKKMDESEDGREDKKPAPVLHENHDTLSFRMDNSDSQKETLTHTANTDNHDDTKNQVTTPDLETILRVSQKLLKVEKEDEMKKGQGLAHKQSSFLVRFKVPLLFAVVLGAAARGVNHWLSPSSPFIHTLPSYRVHTTTTETVTIAIMEDKTKLKVGDHTFRMEARNASSSSFGVGTVALLGLITRLALSSKTVGTTIKMDDSDQDDADVGSDDYCVDQAPPEDPTSDTDAVRASIPIKLEGYNAIVSTYDLSKYEALKVVELRTLLRSRMCNYVGRKNNLVLRLASVYRAELQSLTVVQLRKMLKLKGMKQGGLKEEIIQKLVEAGL